MTRIYIIAILLLWFSLISHGQKSLEQLDQKLDAILVAENIPGSQILIVNKDSILWSKNYGYADLKTKRKVDDNTMFRIASITKSFVATATMQLHQKGEWSINDELESQNPRVEIMNRFKEPVRLIHLLEHTSGLDDLTLGQFAGSCVDCSASEAFKKINTKNEIRWEPGNFTSYTNWGIVYLAESISMKTGMTYEAYVRQNILNPLKMENATFALNSTTKDLLAMGYKGLAEPKAVDYKHMLDAPGKLNCSARELSHFLRMFLANGESKSKSVLSKESISLMESTATNMAVKNGFIGRYGKGLFCSPYEGNTWYGHWGDFKGYHSSMFYNRESGLGYIILINKDEANISKLETIVRQFLVPKKKVETRPNFKINDKYLGYYNSATSRWQFSRFRDYLFPFHKVYEQDGAYFLKAFMDDPIELKLLADNLSYYQKQNGYERTPAFMTSNNHNYMTNGMGNYVQTSFLSVWSRLVIPLLILLIYLFGFVLFPISIISNLIKKTNTLNLGKVSFWLCITSLLSMLLFFTYPALILNDPIGLLGNMSIWSLGYFVTSLLFVFLSILSCWMLYKMWKELSRAQKIFYSTNICVFVVTLLYLFTFDMIGLQTWK